jgi:hypothetical protein
MARLTVVWWLRSRDENGSFPKSLWLLVSCCAEVEVEVWSGGDERCLMVYVSWRRSDLSKHYFSSGWWE